MSIFKDKKILITGAAGTIGSSLVKHLHEQHNPAKILCIDNNESEIFYLLEKYNGIDNIEVHFSDIRNYQDCMLHTRDINIVIHTAALKHVIISEKSPHQAVETNIIGTQNLITAAINAGVDRFLFTSSDKAVNPTNVMGTSKLMGERLVTAANISLTKNMRFSSTRFGNVLNSNGSVLQIFKRQISARECLTLTDTNMTRFVMDVDAAAALVLKSVELMQGGEVFITKMPQISIRTLAEATLILSEIQTHDKEIKVIGKKPGEKLYEELLSEEECGRTIEIQDFYVVMPAFMNLFTKRLEAYTPYEKRVVYDDCISNLKACLSLDETIELIRKYI